MCGILGILTVGQELDLTAVERGRDALTHRGPDGGSLWTDAASPDGGLVVLAHRRLGILDLTERADQPLLYSTEGVCRAAQPREMGGARFALIYNGEIYNYVELREELRDGGHRFHSTGDTEVLLRAYATWGAACVDRLNGMFAFAIWDAARKALFCARDRFGEKPLYYAFDPRRNSFGFASEVKALVAAGLVTPELESRAVYRYFRFGEQAGAEQTIWRDVHRLLPAHTLEVRAIHGQLEKRIHRYWDVQIADDETVSEREAVRAFSETFSDAVRIRLRSDVPIGTSLSGGLDSTSVICEVQRLGATGGQKAFTARMSDPALDEGRFVDVVLTQTGIPGFSIRPEPRTFLDVFDRLYFHQEEPFPSTSLFASYLVHEHARAHGVIVMLDGQGADEYLAGYGHYPALVLTDLARRARLVSWWRERRALARSMGVDPVPPRALPWLIGRRNAGASLLVDQVHETPFFNGDVVAQYAAEAPRTIEVQRDALKTRLYADLMMGHLQELLRYTDRNSMSVSLEVRLPFLDHRLVEQCMRLPSRMLFRDGTSKWVLRQAMQGVVPQQILDRRDKVGFLTPWGQWWESQHQPELRERLRQAEDSLADLVRPGLAAAGTPPALGIMGLATIREQFRSLGSRSAVLAWA